jgi:VIT1/CCC1 family predicted Fe2+/Mn2+ transporter
MIILVTLVIGLVWWITAWSFGINPFDAFLLTVGMVVAAATYVIIKPFVDRLLGRGTSEPEQSGAGF